MKIILAPDKYKGSLTGIEFCNIVAPIFKQTINAEVLNVPLADGGDSTIEVVNYYLNGDTIEVEVNNPVFNKVKANYLYAQASKTAFIEMAEASGLKLLKSHEQNCRHTSTFGTGQLILDAINKGAKHIILGIGGSATNDCGIGMATALGYRFLDETNTEVKPIGNELIKIKTIDDSNVDPRLKSVAIQIACDVTNPLYGLNGAAYVYAKQKGASNSDIEFLNQGLQSFSKILEDHFNVNIQEIAGAGAAGGMGAGCITFLNGTLSPGIELVKQIANFNTKIDNADWIITGEGKLDSQTLSGKAIDGILKSVKPKGIKVATFCGSVDLSPKELLNMGIDYSASVIDRARNLEDALTNTKQYLSEIAKDFATKTKR
ncbi:MAG: glycerate kinase [Flavobacteriaceae bacterium]|uniref:glycerate kinase n=1 Tax=Winogradskyella sp. SYSU M77433 TaxID=3042722 RepID=UPI000C56BC35|nr:glycerate kinase [Winogradskyella sp. SYSU M77433]MAX70893.1 glycerate kinase [Flavobacteriaceae bacterium]MDH7912176.1 glycerate kinase [Winogradskyella sp. SYSU M77433]|tara:strand:- start:1761 stop:2885 length:1125 start_codon:yes stop_codon:yes gene_type:complete